MQIDPMPEANRASEDAGDEAFGGFAVLVVLLPKGMAQGRFFDMDTVEQGGSGRDEDERETGPVAHMHSDGGEDDQHPGVGGMAHQREQSLAVEFLAAWMATLALKELPRDAMAVQRTARPAASIATLAVRTQCAPAKMV